MSRHDHFRQWLVEQSPHSSMPAPSSVRAEYSLPEYRLPSREETRTIGHPIWADPQGLTPPIFTPQESARSQSTAPTSVDRPPVSPSLSPVPPAITPTTSARPVRTASLSEPPPSAQPSSASPLHRPASRLLKGYSYGMLVIVWLGTLGLGGYALSRLADPLFTTSQPSSATQIDSESASPETETARTRRHSTPNSPPTVAPPPPNLFDYADARPRSSSSPIWALVAIITASILGSRLMIQQSQSRRDR